MLNSKGTLTQIKTMQNIQGVKLIALIFEIYHTVVRETAMSI